MSTKNTIGIVAMMVFCVSVISAFVAGIICCIVQTVIDHGWPAALIIIWILGTLAALVIAICCSGPDPKEKEDDRPNF